uniref:Uncharacterized protein n=1 Tax=Nelumbo nucifera TaxID=4432 RepID=A0A822ZV00_NELNU|nr:TPA_asm: hypothetical protein HUJ06_003948 [Nelumbo nucifera]
MQQRWWKLLWQTDSINMRVRENDKRIENGESKREERSSEEYRRC